MKIYATITVIGKDKTGVIARITNYLFEQKANIEALEEQVTRGQFSMILQASWEQEQLDRAGMESGLEAVGQQLGMETSIMFTEPGRLQRMGILVTKESHCLEAILRAVAQKELETEPVVVVSNRPELRPLAEGAGLPFEQIEWEDRTRAEEQAIRVLQKHGADFVTLARFMKILSPNFVWRYKNKIINIHPSLLPSFPGPQAYRQAYEHGVKIIGVTAHFVSMHLDEGPIIAQSAFETRPNMTLREIVAEGQRLEAATLLKAIQLYLAKRLDVYWGVVKEV
ncbi:MAG TPA: formyltetrahydrofolate deformylase [Methylomirabilota bacterium]|nr:formyltetrahydrofolate deformylase [Methylomirabilota bacterium]